MRIVLFFARNPEEVISPHDAVLKWDCTIINAQRAFYKLKTRGLVTVCERNRVGVQVSNLYAAGPALLQAIDQ